MGGGFYWFSCTAVCHTQYCYSSSAVHSFPQHPSSLTTHSSSPITTHHHSSPIITHHHSSPTTTHHQSPLISSGIRLTQPPTNRAVAPTGRPHHRRCLCGRSDGRNLRCHRRCRQLNKVVTDHIPHIPYNAVTYHRDCDCCFRLKWCGVAMLSVVELHREKVNSVSSGWLNFRILYPPVTSRPFHPLTPPSLTHQ